VYNIISLEVTEDKGGEERILQPVLSVLGELQSKQKTLDFKLQSNVIAQ